MFTIKNIFAREFIKIPETETNRVEHNGGKMMRVYKPKEFMIFSPSFFVPFQLGGKKFLTSKQNQHEAFTNSI